MSAVAPSPANPAMRAMARKLGLGALALRARRAMRFGPRVEFDTWRARSRYLKAAGALAPLPCGEGPLDCFVLLNEPRLWEGVWAIYSFRHYHGPCRVIVLNDGTLSGESIATLRRLFPGVSIPEVRANDAEIDAFLEGRGLERCRDWRRRFVFFRKLIDPVYLARTERMLLLDSDVLHFQPPEEVWRWTQSGEGMRFAADLNPHPFFAPADELAAICGAPLPEHFCAGYLYLTRKSVDLARIERHLADALFEAQRRDGSFNHVAEQTLYAMEGAVTGAQVLPAPYATCPDPLTETAVMGHFCGGEAPRTWFYTRGLPLLARRFGLT